MLIMRIGGVVWIQYLVSGSGAEVSKERLMISSGNFLVAAPPLHLIKSTPNRPAPREKLPIAQNTHFPWLPAGSLFKGKLNF